MNYPDHEITDPAPNLPPEVAAQLAPYLEEAHRKYSRFRLRFRENPVEVISEEPGIVVEHAADVFRVLVARLLKSRPRNFNEFRRALSIDDGAADTAWRYAHFLYHDVQGGRMLFIWHRQIQDRLWDLIREAEDIWWNPGIVPKGWEGFLEYGDAQAPACQNSHSEPALIEGAPASTPEPANPEPASHDPAVAESATPDLTLRDAAPPDFTSDTAEIETDTPAAEGAEDRHEIVCSFIRKCLAETGVAVKKKMIWMSCGYTEATEFQRWQRRDPRTTAAAAENFPRVLSMQPPDFIELLRRQRLLL